MDIKKLIRKPKTGNKLSKLHIAILFVIIVTQLYMVLMRLNVAYSADLYQLEICKEISIQPIRI